MGTSCCSPSGEGWGECPHEPLIGVGVGIGIGIEDRRVRARGLQSTELY